MSDEELSPVRRTILELESRTWAQDGAKIAEFRRRHPRITETGYYVVLDRLLADPCAYTYAGGRYASLLNRIARARESARTRRLATRTGEDLS